MPTHGKRKTPSLPPNRPSNKRRAQKEKAQSFMNLLKRGENAQKKRKEKREEHGE